MSQVKIHSHNNVLCRLVKTPQKKSWAYIFPTDCAKSDLNRCSAVIFCLNSFLTICSMWLILPAQVSFIVSSLKYPLPGLQARLRRHHHRPQSIHFCLMQTAHLNGKHFLDLPECNLVGESDATGQSQGGNGFCLETRLVFTR